MDPVSSERVSKPSHLLCERLDGFDTPSDDKRSIYLYPVVSLRTTDASSVQRRPLFERERWDRVKGIGMDCMAA